MDELEEIRKKRIEELKKDVERSNFPSTPVEITDAEFGYFIEKYPVAVIDCWAPWCGPCRRIAPVIEELAASMQGKVVFGKLNTDLNRVTSMEYQISAIPTLLVFQNGKLSERIVGALPKEQIVEKITPLIQG
ncbi:thioredoxin 1 [Methanohalophilus levihalophilus]|uniref:thioredoxin n=1 Tax=Methanohalophilus levihalophilus TaxID=1431282 RepID=UPI001AE1AC61|nr:thioredoxin [Methanohalophilus levihalophilus]MBP2029857.1 thioredoxin 1 [Methanohalophilus levihalophilus]